MEKKIKKTNKKTGKKEDGIVDLGQEKVDIRSTKKQICSNIATEFLK